MLAVFDIFEPATVQEASQFLAEHEFEAAVYAGGTELLLLMKEGLVHYPHLVNIKTIPNLSDIALDEAQKTLRIGSVVTHRQLEQSPMIQQYAPLLAEVEAMVANIRVRSAGTIGGNLCFAEPHSDPGTLLLAWGGTLRLDSGEGSRELPVDEFFVGLLETARRPHEILSEIQLPLLRENSGGGYEKFSTHERPTANVAAIVQMQNGDIQSARLAVGSVGPTPIRVPDAENLLQGQQPDDELFAAAADSVAQAVDPVDDIYGSADYKRHLARVLTTRVLKTAIKRAEA